MESRSLNDVGGACDFGKCCTYIQTLEMPQRGQRSDTTITAHADREGEKGRPSGGEGSGLSRSTWLSQGRTTPGAPCDWHAPGLTQGQSTDSHQEAAWLWVLALPHEAVRSGAHHFVSLGLSLPVCEMLGLGKMVIKWGPWQVIAYGERTKIFWLKKAASFTPL